MANFEVLLLQMPVLVLHQFLYLEPNIVVRTRLQATLLPDQDDVFGDKPFKYGSVPGLMEVLGQHFSQKIEVVIYVMKNF